MSTTITRPFAATFAADPVHSSCKFVVAHMGVGTFRALFDDTEAHVVAGIRFEGSTRVESISTRPPPEFRDHVVYAHVLDGELPVDQAHDAFDPNEGLVDPELRAALADLVIELVDEARRDTPVDA